MYFQYPEVWPPSELPKVNSNNICLLPEHNVLTAHPRGDFGRMSFLLCCVRPHIYPTNQLEDFWDVFTLLQEQLKSHIRAAKAGLVSDI